MVQDFKIREAEIRNMMYKEDRLAEMIAFVKECYGGYDLPDMAWEWHARDQLNMPMTEKEIEEHKLNLKVEYSDEEFFKTTGESTEASGSTGISHESISVPKEGDGNRQVWQEQGKTDTPDETAK